MNELVVNESKPSGNHFVKTLIICNSSCGNAAIYWKFVVQLPDCNISGIENMMTMMMQVYVRLWIVRLEAYLRVVKL